MDTRVMVDGNPVRRRIVVVVSVCVGAVLLAFSLTTRPGDNGFYALTAGLAAVWVIGAFASGPLHLGRIEHRGELRRPVLSPFLLGIGIAAFFVVGSLVAREIGPIRRAVHSVLAHADHSSLVVVAVITGINGIAEELFFRGAVFDAVPARGRVAITTAVYALVTLAGGNLMLTFAAVTVGAVWAIQRERSYGILASSITHVTWSLAMLFILPSLFS